MKVCLRGVNNSGRPTGHTIKGFAGVTYKFSQTYDMLTQVTGGRGISEDDKCLDIINILSSVKRSSRYLRLTYSTQMSAVMEVSSFYSFEPKSRA